MAIGCFKILQTWQYQCGAPYALSMAMHNNQCNDPYTIELSDTQGPIVSIKYEWQFIGINENVHI